MVKSLYRTVGLIGYGKFTRLLVELFQKILPDIQVMVSSRTNPVDGKLFFEKELVYQSELIIPCVPIRFFQESLRSIVPSLKDGQTILDICSVKLYPEAVMLDVVPEGINLVASHPMFGPASYVKMRGNLSHCCTIVENLRADLDHYQRVKDLYQAFGTKVVEMSADAHDQKAAKFQFLTLTTATVLKEMGLEREEIDTPSALKMLDFLDMVSVDSDLVADLYHYNPYCSRQFSHLVDVFTGLQNKMVNQESPALMKTVEELIKKNFSLSFTR